MGEGNDRPAYNWWKFWLIVATVLFLLAFISFNLGLVLAFSFKRLLWGGLTVTQIWVGAVLLSTVIYGFIYVRVSATSNTSDETRIGVYGRIRRALWIYMGINAVAFVLEVALFYVYRFEYLGNFFSTVFPLISV